MFKKMVMILVLGIGSAAKASSIATPGIQNLIGRWHFTKIIYEGQEMEMPNPDLKLSMTFFDNQSLRLFWHRGNMMEFCESFSTWSLEEKNSETRLTLNTFAVNPNNQSDCAKDPDMQIGTKPSVLIWVDSGSLMMSIMLSDQNLIYVFEQTPKESL
ncbi:MAG: hypothetical protein ACK5P5_11940 [Pseudobdellovibrionaceae bacterium]